MGAFKKVSQGIISFVSQLTSGTIFEIKNIDGVSVLNVSKDGKVGIGTTSPSKTLHVQGEITSSSQISSQKINITNTSVGPPITAQMPFANANIFDGYVGGVRCIGLLGSNSGGHAQVIGFGNLRLKSQASNNHITITENGSTVFTSNLGTTTGLPSAQVEMRSTTQGFLPPRMTITQRDAIPTPSTGLIIYQTDGANGLYLYDGSVWRALAMV